MQTIRRLKGDQTHYAKSLAATGAVAAWLIGQDAAADATPFEESATARVRDYYSERPEAGLLQFVDGHGKVVYEQGDRGDATMEVPPVSLDALSVQLQTQQVEIELLRERVEKVESMIE
jgi:hypothetical protein